MVGTTDLTGEQIKEVPCIRCNAKAGESCLVECLSHQKRMPSIGYCVERVELRRKMPILPDNTEHGNVNRELTATEKSLICYYGFVMLADSCSVNAEKLFGKPMSSREIQVAFARRAVRELKKDGLIK